MANNRRVPLQDIDANKKAAPNNEKTGEGASCDQQQKHGKADGRKERHERAQAALRAKKAAAEEAQQKNVDAAKDRIRARGYSVPPGAKLGGARRGKPPPAAHDPAAWGAPTPPAPKAAPKPRPAPRAAHWQGGAPPPARTAKPAAGKRPMARKQPTGGKPKDPPMPPTLAQRVNAALAKVHERLQRGDIVGAREEIEEGRKLSISDPRLVMAGLT